MSVSGLRRSGVSRQNPQLEEIDPAKLERREAEVARSNLAWLQSTGYSEGVLLLGGTSIVDFRMRVAQSELRQDLLPSFWSTCGFLIGGDTLLTARVDAIADSSARVERNGLESVKLKAGVQYDDATRYPNVAILQFAADHAAIIENVVRIGQERNIVDLLAQIVAWLGYCWAVNGCANPLLNGHGIPSATLVERAHGLASIDLSPGLPSASSCPEAIWQAARWWYEAYEPIEGAEATTPAPFIPRGAYIVRQPAAAAVGIRDDFEGAQIVQTSRVDPLFAALRGGRKPHTTGGFAPEGKRSPEGIPREPGRAKGKKK